MHRPANLFRTLRRHRASVGRLVLAWFALAAASAGAAPCFAMAVAEPAAPHHDRPHADMAAGHHHANPAAEAPTAAAGDRSPAACPHCPLASAMSSNTAAGSHSLCAADDAADGGAPGVSVPAFQPLPALATVHPPPIDWRPSRTYRQQRPSGVAGAAVALNLRYCVFLI
jgi:hypothetical protein